MITELSKRVDHVLISRDQIDRRVQELGRQITEDYRDATAALVMVGILKGAILFMADLMKSVDLDVMIDFMAVSSYGASTVSSGDVRILKDLDHNITGKNILLVEDIIDTGYTLAYLRDNLLQRGAASVRIAAMLNKQARRVTDIRGDYIGFEIPDEFVVGYGLDYDQKLRNLPYVGAIVPELGNK